MSYIYVTDVKIVVCTIADNSFLSTAESRDFLKLGFGCCSVACQCSNGLHVYSDRPVVGTLFVI